MQGIAVNYCFNELEVFVLSIRNKFETNFFKPYKIKLYFGNFLLLGHFLLKMIELQP